jgi:hypothetical protein
MFTVELACTHMSGANGVSPGRNQTSVPQGTMSLVGILLLLSFPVNIGDWEDHLTHLLKKLGEKGDGPIGTVPSIFLPFVLAFPVGHSLIAEAAFIVYQHAH